MPRGYVCKQRFGVALFENEASPKSGWACLSDASPFYFLSLQELPRDVVWLSNIPGYMLHGHSFHSLHHIKPNNYLFTPVSELIRELGLKHDTVRYQSSYLANIFFNIMNHLYLQTGTYGDRHDALNTEIRRVCLPDELPVTASTAEACNHIVARHNVRSGDPDGEHQGTTLLFHRYEYARQLLSTQLPFGRWSKVSNSIVESGQKYLSEWIRNISKPLIIKVNVSFVDSLAERLFSICRPSSNLHWVTLNEYSWLTRFSELEILDALVCEGYGPSPVFVPELGRVSENSYSFGLYCESVWTSLTKTLNGYLSTTPLSAWLIGNDRVMCLDKAYNIEKNTPFIVSTLGYGRIQLASRVESKTQMPNIAFQHGLIAPMCEPEDTFHRTLPDAASPSQFMQVVMERGASGFIQQTDIRALDDAIDLYDQKVYERAPYRTIAL